MLTFLRKLFDTSDRDVKNLQPIIDDINNWEDRIQALSDDELRAKGAEFKKRAQGGESLDSLLPEVFATVREVSRVTLGMRQFDVQLVGGVVLHQGRIAEMRTGEGKTLVAVAPMILNAMTGKGAHLVTVNDYLARRDAVWMGPVYHFLGLSVGIVQGQGEDNDELGGSYIYDPHFEHDDPRYMSLRPCSRREAYECDITYGTNHEFGFDYLRDNMAFSEEYLSMRELNYAVIDEVDSILIDEARTPHIISGPSSEDISVYRQVDTIVRQLKIEEHYTVDKKNHSASFTEDGMDFLEQAFGIDNIADEPRLFHHAGAAIKAYGLFEKDVHYVVRNNEVVIVDENTGRMMFGRRYSDGLHQALEAKEKVTVQQESQTVAVITFQNLFRMYNKLAGMTGTAKTEEDEFRKIYGLDVVTIPTNRPSLRQDQVDVVYKTMDAKFRGIGREILRLYAKQQPCLVGTRSIEMTEKVSTRLSPESLQKLILSELLVDKFTNDKSFPKDAKKDAEATFRTAIEDLDLRHLKDVMRLAQLPVDPVSDEVTEWFLATTGVRGEHAKEFLVEALEHGVPHNVLNAKYHEREALIISEAGRKGAITIATNMAGRGVDILLGGRVEDEVIKRARDQEEQDGGLASEYADTFLSFRRGGKERAAPPLPLDDTERRAAADEVRELGGLFILGTERHESRRIDNQLRGRAGRQGDPGESRFFVSLEDTLWKIFNNKMLENPLLKAWPDLEVVNNKMITKMIQSTQERIENHFFEARKHTLEYDDVLNAQREHIYAMRREVLLGKDCRAELKSGIQEYIGEIVDSGWFQDEEGQGFASDEVYEKLNDLFPLVDTVTLSEFEEIDPGDTLRKFCIDKAMAAYDEKIRGVGEEVMRQIEQQVMLRAVNDRWMEHLQMIDYIREGINLRGYGQVDPLVAYKKETFDLFQHTLRGIRNEAARLVFVARVNYETSGEDDLFEAHEPGDVDLETVDWKKIGRNDPCPCGSGEKFKNCHYKTLREEGVI